MAVSLKKGQKVNLSKENSGLSTVVVGLGWDAAISHGLFKKPAPIDCDAFALALSNGKLASKYDIVYFGNLRHDTNAIIHMGDNLTGDGDGDDEQIVINLPMIPSSYDRIVIGVNIYRAKAKNQHFGMVKNAFIRLVDQGTDSELYRYNLSENYEGMTSMVFGEIYRHDGDWKFGAIGSGSHAGSITEFASDYYSSERKIGMCEIDH